MFPQGFDSRFHQVDAVEEMKLRAWARRNFRPENSRDASWHPIVLDEMQRRDEYGFGGFGSGGGAGGSVRRNPSAADTEFEVILTSFGNSKPEVVKAIFSTTGLSLKRATEFFDVVPKSVKTAVSWNEADHIRKLIESVGGQAVIAQASDPLPDQTSTGSSQTDELRNVPEVREQNSLASPAFQPASSDTEWTDAKNSRRIELLVLRASRRLSEQESRELETLQERCAKFLDEKAPLLFDKLSQIEDQIKRAEDDNAP